MKDQDDKLVKDLIKKYKLDQKLAIEIMYLVRSNLPKYFEIINKE